MIQNISELLEIVIISQKKIWPELLLALALAMLGLTFQHRETTIISRLKASHHGSSGRPTALSPYTTGSTTSSPTPNYTPTSASSTSTTTTTSLLPTEPGGGRTLFPEKQVVAFYGAPGGGALGILGRSSPEAMWPRLAAQAKQYEHPNVQILPTYELVTFVAQNSPQPNGTYSGRLSNSEIQNYLDVVRKHHGLLILDIQPGRGNFLTEAQTLTPFLRQPDVALALDPEWQASMQNIPGQVIGSTTGAQINQVSAWLEQLTTANHLPQKLLLIHQFTSWMIQDKSSVTTQPDLAIVFNMDGFGRWKAKLSSYQKLSADSRFRLGFKLFYNQDTPMKNPQTVLALKPQPVVVEYE